MEVLFVRHGQTEWNKIGRMQGSTDIHLNETGREQARVLALQLADKKIDVIYASPLKRALETAEIVKGERTLEIITDSRLAERSFGSLEGSIYADIPDYAAWWDEEQDGNFEDMEHMKSLLARVADFLNDIAKKHKDDTVLIVAHGGVSGAVKCYYDNIRADRTFRGNIIKNCTVASYKI